MEFTNSKQISHITQFSYLPNHIILSICVVVKCHQFFAEWEKSTAHYSMLTRFAFLMIVFEYNMCEEHLVSDIQQSN